MKSEKELLEVHGEEMTARVGGGMLGAETVMGMGRKLQQ